jgi:three-Cys-motif partner protein
MDKRGIIQEHSKIKLELYRLYLERYLSVLLSTPFFNNIEVSDIFAGSGISQNEEKGSAILAAETIASVMKEHNQHGKQVKLNLNDSNLKNCTSLREHLKAYDFVIVTCTDANQCIQLWDPDRNTQNLFFIDPHGYTQVSTANLKRLFTTPKCDFLIFIPINHIYRFLNPSDIPSDQEDSGILPELGLEGSKSQVEANNYYEPIKNFLAGLGVEQADARAASSVEKFSELIVAALQRISGSEYVYCQMIQNQENSNKYGLYFISKHVLGAEKFLDAQGQLKKKLHESSQQQAFDFVSQPESDSILRFVKFDHAYDNVALYLLSIRSGILPAELNKELIRLEQNGKIQVTDFPGASAKRRGKSFYINYEYQKKSDRRISVIFRG